ncbi:MAG: sulfatase-like hydrolase/transferase [Verrucomicrobiae bacterium]|nr:sulfatase-like hydrolase/transferase [Verrucomicrobiae bacterium]
MIRIFSILGALILSTAIVTARPNIVLVMADDQGWGDMAYNGHPDLKTPHFDQFAAEAIRFDHFYAAAPVCSPTRASVLTGRHPNRMGTFKWGYPIRPQEDTLAEVLHAAGYRTGHFGKWHLGSVQTASPVHPGACGFDEWLSAPNFFENDPILSRNGKAEQMIGESSDVTATAALDFLKRNATKDSPAFAVVWFGSPHLPHVAAPEDLAQYPDTPTKKANFYGEITGMDRALGKLRAGIAELGLRDDTIYWYCSDNGGLMPESSGGRMKKGSIYEGGLRVPAILEWPARFKSAQMIDTPCVTSDIFPTVLELAGVEPRTAHVRDGISIADILDGKVKHRPASIGFWDFKAGGRSVPSAKWMKELLDSQAAGTELDDKERLRLDAGVIARQYSDETFPGHAAWLDWPWKLHRIENVKKDAPGVIWELYNLETDPLESKSLIAEQPERVKQMQTAMTPWLKSVVGSLNGKDYASP